MHSWINGPHFPDELRISVLTSPNSGLEPSILAALSNSISNCEWSPESIGEAVTSAFRDNQIDAKEGYRTLYLAILGAEKGPRLAPILAELDRNHVLKLLG
jgi:lysyl-tRNA synthetase class 1